MHLVQQLIAIAAPQFKTALQTFGSIRESKKMDALTSAWIYHLQLESIRRGRGRVVDGVVSRAPAAGAENYLIVFLNEAARDMSATIFEALIKQIEKKLDIKPLPPPLPPPLQPIVKGR